MENVSYVRVVPIADRDLATPEGAFRRAGQSGLLCSEQAVRKGATLIQTLSGTSSTSPATGSTSTWPSRAVAVAITFAPFQTAGNLTALAFGSASGTQCHPCGQGEGNNAEPENDLVDLAGRHLPGGRTSPAAGSTCSGEGTL